MKVLVTGSNGYIGSRAALALENAGHEVIPFDKPGNGRNIIMPSNLADAMKEKPAAVVHLAAEPDIRQGERLTNKYWQVNGLGTANVVRAAFETDSVQTFVFGSSLCVKSPGVSHYKLTKLAGEAIVAAGLRDRFLRCGGARAYALRIGNAAGGETPPSHTPAAGRIIPSVVRCLKQDLSLTINGSAERVKRDFVHIDDVAQAIVSACEWNLTGTGDKQSGKIEIYDIGRGVGVPLSSVIQVAERLAEKQLKVIEKERGQGEPEETLADLESHNWRPKYNFDQIVDSVWRCYDEPAAAGYWQCGNCDLIVREENCPRVCSNCNSSGPWNWSE